jgi:dTDP-4-dehydrorhamnose 3,5-epimerase
MTFTPTPLEGCYVVGLTPFSDNRGWFSRFYCKDEFAQIGHTAEWVQANHSFTKTEGTIRGMHFQRRPHLEIKLVRCIRGAVLDVVVDIRKNSPTFLQSFAIELSEENKKMIYIPEGFAHGFQTLQENAELLYFHSAMYSPGVEKGLKFDDPALNIKWPLPVSEISDRDQQHQLINKDFQGI